MFAQSLEVRTVGRSSGFCRVHRRTSQSKLTGKGASGGRGDIIRDYFLFLVDGEDVIDGHWTLLMRLQGMHCHSPGSCSSVEVHLPGLQVNLAGRVVEVVVVVGPAERLYVSSQRGSPKA